MPRTQEELKQVALDLFHGLIFTDRHCKTPDEVRMVFTIFMFMKQEQIDEMKKNPPALIYEYYSKAMPRTCNGLPMFLSMHTLNEEDTKTMLGYYKKLQEASEEALK